MGGSHHHHHHGMASMTGGQQMGRDLYDDDDKDRWGSELEICSWYHMGIRSLAVLADERRFSA